MKFWMAVLGFCAALPGLALNRESWVASYGQGGGCTRLSPCANFQAAVNATMPGGIVRAVDTADYGPVTISQPITIDGNGTGASITVSGSLAKAIDIEASQATIRNLVLNATGSAETGIAAAQTNAVIENVTIVGPFNAGILCFRTRYCTMRNVSVRGAQYGVLIQGTVGSSIRDSVFQANTYGVYVQGDKFFSTPLPASAMIERTEISFNSNTGIVADGNSAPVVVRYGDCVVTGNTLGLNNTIGEILTYRTNMLVGNITDAFGPIPGISEK
jgi:hypothetical protein